jgi:hypothetical protein
METETIPEEAGKIYFNEVLTVVNVPLRLVPKLFTAAIIASEMPAAIRPYSIAVAPDWSDRKFKMLRFKPASYSVVLKRFNEPQTSHRTLN